ncbi:TetR family transcriptional regulator [Streptomyces sp. NPDC007084]|uniref:TetR/AcrR family transcriptional regulator n=1 Tax=Streptomyces sp. NPDC007084 TaxID=3154313 RepID=UPI003451A60D
MNHAAPRRSDATRAAILSAARERFAADGYERATIRSIAADARIDPAMVMRYFGTKAGLFAAAATLDLQLPDPAAIPRDCAGTAIAAHFLERWENDEALAAMLRGAATNDYAAAEARRVFTDQVRPMVAGLCPNPEEATIRAALIDSQLLGIALNRYLLRLPPIAALSRAEIAAWIGPTIQRYLTGPLPSDDSEPFTTPPQAAPDPAS